MTTQPQDLDLDREALDDADSHLRAAVLLLAGPPGDAPHAAHHLSRAWHRLAKALDADTPRGEAVAEVLRDRGLLDARPDDRLSEESFRALETLAQGPPWGEVDLAVLDAHLEALAGSIARARGLGPKASRTSRRRLGWAFLLGMVLVVFLGWALWRGDEPQGPWRATFYPRPDLEGTPEVVYLSGVDLEVTDAPPVPGLPRRGFSVRWESCLEIEATRTVLFQLVSEGGARLRVDGTLVLDAWQPHTLDSRSREIDLAAGRHQLQLDYTDSSDLARVALLATMSSLGQPATEAPSQLPADRLSAPRSGICGEPSGP